MVFAVTTCAITKYLLLYALKIAHFFTTTDRLRRSPLYLGLSPSCAHSLLRSFVRLHGVNHNTPFPTALQFIFQLFQCFRRRHVSNALIPCLLHTKHAEGMSLRYDANCTYTLIAAEIWWGNLNLWWVFAYFSVKITNFA